MPFKIVRTLEKGKYSHWIVPSAWESNKIVKWPKRNISQLVKCDDFLPDPDWQQMKCQVKRNNIPTYKDAERELDILLCATDTDEDQVNDKMAKSKPQEVDLNALVEQMTTNQYEPLMIVSNEPNGSSSEFRISGQQKKNRNVIVEQVTNQYNSPVITVPDESSESSSQIILTSNNQILSMPTNTYCVLAENQDHCIDKTQENSDLNKIFNNINLVLENHDKKMDTILENQKKIMHKMACISVQVDNMQLQLCNFNEDVVPLKMSKNHVDNFPFSFSPIATVEDLSKINDLLSDKTVRKQLKQTFSIVCSAGGKGINCAYKLVDVMFSRDFLCQCSWSGSSRSDGVKISLKCYKNIVSFFWEMIFSWDQTFTLQSNELFFKNILKNSNKRNNAKQERLSTTRKRVKIAMTTSSTEPKNNAGNIEQDTDVTEKNNKIVFPATAENNVENQPTDIPGIKNDSIVLAPGDDSVNAEKESLC